ncbi:hypothetical protein ACN28S_61160 [Cystobacter fuscus]
MGAAPGVVGQSGQPSAKEKPVGWTKSGSPALLIQNMFSPP